MEELRHSTSKGPNTSAPLNDLVSHLDQNLATIKAQVETLHSPLAVGEDEGQAVDREELKEQWEKLLRARGLLQEELKEEGWLIRFRMYVTLAEVS